MAELRERRLKPAIVDVASYAFRVVQNALDFAHTSSVRCRRGRSGELDVDEQVALIFVGTKPGGGLARLQPAARVSDDERQSPSTSLRASAPATDTYPSPRSVETAIEAAEEATAQAALRPAPRAGARAAQRAQG